MNHNHSNNKKILTSGIFIILPCIENYTKVDLRTSAIDIPPQEVCLSTVYVVSIVADKFCDWNIRAIHNLTPQSVEAILVLGSMGWFREHHFKVGAETLDKITLHKGK